MEFFQKKYKNLERTLQQSSVNFCENFLKKSTKLQTLPRMNGATLQGFLWFW